MDFRGNSNVNDSLSLGAVESELVTAEADAQGVCLLSVPRHVRAAFIEKPRQSWSIGTTGWLTPVRHRDRATRTDKTAHPQFHAGPIARHRADLSMSLHRLGLAHRVRGHPDVRGIPRLQAPYAGPGYETERV